MIIYLFPFFFFLYIYFDKIGSINYVNSKSYVDNNDL